MSEKNHDGEEGRERERESETEKRRSVTEQDKKERKQTDDGREKCVKGNGKFGEVEMC